MTLYLMLAVIAFLMIASPTLAYQKFSRAPGECRGSGIFSLLAGVLAVLGIGVFSSILIYQARGERPATMTEDATVSASSQRSLFDSTGVVRHDDASVHFGPKTSPSWAGVLIPIALVTTFLLATISLAFGANRIRGGLKRLLPVALVAGAVMATFFITFSRNDEPEPTVVYDSFVGDQAAISSAPEQHETISGPLTRPAGPLQRPSGAPTPVDPPAKELIDSSSIDDDGPTASPVIEFVSTHAAGVERSALPEWAEVSDNSGSIKVIDSGLHATVELAEQEALGRLRSLLRTEFLRVHPEAGDWQPPDSVVLNSGSILRRAVEHSQIQVGEFTNPMYETYWQVDTTAHGPLYQAWRPTVVLARLGWIGGAIAMLTLLLGSLAMFLRFRTPTAMRN